jgi:antitoxin (DNA-binding transcriptional repressor) of toxin-antitoxin stability system
MVRRVQELTAIEAARTFFEVLDAVERRDESFLIMRGGRPVAKLEPLGRANGSAVKSVLKRSRVDAAWAQELAELRAGLHA